jgi:hypothetical protein
VANCHRAMLRHRGVGAQWMWRRVLVSVGVAPARFNGALKPAAHVMVYTLITAYVPVFR